MVAVLLSELIPRQLRAEEEAALTEAYKSPSVNLPKGVVLYLLKLMGLSSADRHRNSTRDDPKKQHVEMFIQNSDNAFVQNLVAAGYTPTDMRRLNGQSEDAAFTDFIDVVHEMLPKRDQLAGEERRDGAPSSGAPAGKAAAIRPSSLAPSMRALHSQGEKNDVCRHRNPRPIRRWDQQDSSLFYLCYVHVPFAPRQSRI